MARGWLFSLASLTSAVSSHHHMALDWAGAVYHASSQGRLMELIESLPRARWTEQSPIGETLLHYACIGDNMDAVVALLRHGLDANAQTSSHWCPVHYAASEASCRVLEVLHVVGVDLRVPCAADRTPLEIALNSLPSTAERVRELLANGVRLSTAHVRCHHRIPPEMVAFERGVLRCRSAVVTLLGLKRRRVESLQIVDRWMVREVCYAVWATRANKPWQ